MDWYSHVADLMSQMKRIEEKKIKSIKDE